MRAFGGLDVYNPDGLNLGHLTMIIANQITSARNH